MMLRLNNGFIFGASEHQTSPTAPEPITLMGLETGFSPEFQTLRVE